MKVALVVGHNQASQGAVNYLGESEYSFNKRIAQKALFKCKDRLIDDLIIIHRPSGDYNIQCKYVADELSKNDVNVSIHLHFNSFASKVHRSELIYFGDSPLRGAIRNLFHADKVNHVKRGERGHKMISMAQEISSMVCSVIFEPCYGNFRTQHSVDIFENEDKYVDRLVDIVQILDRKVY